MRKFLLASLLLGQLVNIDGEDPFKPHLPGGRLIDKSASQ